MEVLRPKTQKYTVYASVCGEERMKVEKREDNISTRFDLNNSFKNCLLIIYNTETQTFFLSLFH